MSYTEAEGGDADGPLQDYVTDQSLSIALEDGQFGVLPPDFVDDFTLFLDSLPIPTHPFSPTYQPIPLFPDLDLPLPVNFEDSHDSIEVESFRPQARSLVQLHEPNITDFVLSQFGSRLPSLQPEDRPPLPVSHHRARRPKNKNPLVSAECRHRILDQLSKFSGLIKDDFILPSRHTLSRLVSGYFNTFHDHYPFIHVPTLDLEDVNIELVIAISALGARYTREPEIGLELFHVARAVVLERIQSYRIIYPAIIPEDPPHLPLADHTSHEISEDWNKPPADDDKCRIEMMQTVLLLIAIATWYKHEPAASDALSIRSVLDALIRQDGIAQIREESPKDWQTWIRFETRKRTQLIVFCFFNMHTIVFDLPPMMLASELQVDLPCSEREWKAGTEQEWQEAQRMFTSPRQDFGEAFEALFIDSGGHYASSLMNDHGFSSLGGHALIHAVIQQIWLTRNTRLFHRQQNQSNLPLEEMTTFESALRRWASCWERSQESSMDPLSPHGPIAFTSTALLRLAYIRLNLNLGLGRFVSSWDPNLIAESFHQSPPVHRSDALTRAALHCAHALSIPVKLGINYVAQTQVIYWSNQHALCSLECALLLSKWLTAATASNPTPPLTPAEEKLLNFVVQLVAETEYNVSSEQIIQRKERLNAITVRLWAKLYQASSVWEMVNLIGQSLNLYADLLERKHEHNNEV